ncbi:MAG: phage holin family protein [Gallionellaceae bacterium]|nr:phage holin family protein [Gallionellaceae bacterium]
MSPEAQDHGTGQRGGLFNSLRMLAATLVATGQTRLELFSIEIEEERTRLGSMLLWTLAAMFCAALCIVLVTLWVVVVFWDDHRLLALGILAFLFLLGALLAGWIALGKARAKPRLFAASIRELSKDREQLTPRP